MEQTPEQKAQQIIDAELEAKTGILNLNNLDLKELPTTIRGMSWLKVLNLSAHQYWDVVTGGWKLAEHDIAIDPFHIQHGSADYQNRAIELPLWLDQLIKLEVINLSGGNFLLPKLKPQYPSLKYLYMNLTKGNDLNPLSELTSLKEVSFSNTEISDLSPLSGLTALQKIQFNETKVNDLSPLADITSLIEVSLASTEISDLSPLSGLTALQNTRFSNTQVNDLNPLSGLTALQGISLAYTEVTDLSSLSGLKSLTYIDFSGTQISDLDPLSVLTSLQDLQFSNTLITNLSPLRNLVALSFLAFDNTKISDLSPLKVLAQLSFAIFNDTNVCDLRPLATSKNLKYVFCQNTQVYDLSPLHGQIKKGLKLNIRNCPLFIPPIEFVEQGNESIVEYFDQVNEKASSLNEIKIILLGEGTAGKTSLVRHLQGEEFNSKEGQTHGIRIRNQKFEIANESITARIWDFGGQETMHATHQFFLSERCIYVLVLNSRQGDDRDRAEYWLKHARSYGGNSPVLVVMNKIDENPSFEVDRGFLSEKYPQIQNYHRISCFTGEGVDDFKQALLSQIEQAKSRKTPFPKAWSNVKEHFDSLDQNYINNAAYQQICQEHKLDKPLSQGVLLGFLHDLGVLINFDKLLQYSDMQILNPRWLTNGVYRVINSKRLAKNHGMLCRNELDEVINKEEQETGNTVEDHIIYPKDKLPIIIEVMQKFQLCYQLDSQRYVIPSLLAKQEPEFSFEGAIIHFEVHFDDFLPPSLFPNLMVKLHSFIEGTNNWRNGMILSKPEIFKARARVQVDREDKKLIIHCCGEEPRRLLSFIRKTIQEIVDSFAHLKYDERVAIPNDKKLLVFKDYDDLVIHEQEGEKTIFVSDLRQKISVKDILDGVEDPKMRDEQAQTPVKAFISYSRKDRDGLEALISALAPACRLGNLQLWYDKAIDAGKEWEKTIFDELKSSDIVLCLISADFINSDFCDRELNNALARHQEGKQKIIPVQWRNCNWDSLPIQKLQGLVNEPIKSLQEHLRDDAWTEAAKMLDPQIEEVRSLVIQRKNRQSYDLLNSFS